MSSNYTMSHLIGRCGGSPIGQCLACLLPEAGWVRQQGDRQEQPAWRLLAMCIKDREPVHPSQEAIRMGPFNFNLTSMHNHPKRYRHLNL